MFFVEPKGKKSAVAAVGGDDAKVIICGAHVTKEDLSIH
jgi:hypothetical protein